MVVVYQKDMIGKSFFDVLKTTQNNHNSLIINGRLCRGKIILLNIDDFLFEFQAKKPLFYIK